VEYLTNRPLVFAVLSFLFLWLCAWVGAGWLRRYFQPPEEVRSDFNVVLGASLTMLGLIIGFSFSMAISRYDLRKANEESEANAIGTEYLRADLLPAADAERLRPLLRDYLAQRIEFYRTRNPSRAREATAGTSGLQERLWSAVVQAARAQPTPVTTLVAAGMNDVLNSEGYAEAGWRNRIPRTAWLLMGLIAVLCNLMVGYNTVSSEIRGRLLAMLPLLVSVAFFLISDIDSPRGGVVRVTPDNLLQLSAGLK
jgi:hypothetical protein